VFGSVINAVLTGFVELILFTFSIHKGLGPVVLASVTGAFLMNLLVIPGLAIISAGLKSKEVLVNKNVQSVSSTFMFIVITAVFFPTVLYRFYERGNIKCAVCGWAETSNIVTATFPYVNCSNCEFKGVDKFDDDPAYIKMARPFVFVVSASLPLLFIVAIFFSLKTHRYFWEQFEAEIQDDSRSSLSTLACVILLVINGGLFSVVCEVLTDHIGKAINEMYLTPRFVGLVFYTLIPSVAEFINAMKFAWEGHLGLSLEIGSQGAMVVSLIQMPALVLISELIGSKSASSRFTLIFDGIDVYAVIISILLRNMMLMEKTSVNYLTGFAFLVTFGFIAVVYFYLEE
jgi:Ca2+:H+ antiporter